MPPEDMPQVTEGELMMVNTLVVRSDCREEFMDELRRILPLARQLPACLALEVGEVVDQSGTFVLTERWRSGNEYLHEILGLDFYQRYLAASEPLYAAPRSVLVLRSVT